MGFDPLPGAASRALTHRSPGRVDKLQLMGLPEVGKLARNAVTERSARVLLDPPNNDRVFPGFVLALVSRTNRINSELWSKYKIKCMIVLKSNRSI